MATQRHLGRAIANDRTTPRMASNMRLVSNESGSLAAVCGGSNGSRFIIAIRRPLNEQIVYRGVPFGGRVMNYLDVRNQIAKIRRTITSETDEFTVLDEECPRVEDTSDVREIHPQW